MRNIYVFGFALIMSGCASVTGNKLQPVSVQTIENNKEIVGAGCTLTNDAGKWFVSTPGSVTIQKSTGDLAVDCKKENDSVGHETIVSKANGAVWGNIILGGAVGYIVDRNTGAGFDYPAVITVVMNKINAAMGLSTATQPLPSPEVATTGAASASVAN